jgi:hypothetical protein
MSNTSSPSSINPEFDAAYARYQQAIQDYFKAATAALAQYTKALEEAAARCREAEEAIMKVLHRSMAAYS